MKKLFLATLLIFAFSSSASARDCIAGFNKVPLANDGDLVGQYECVKIYPAKQNTICPPLFRLTKTGAYTYSCTISGIKARYMCKSPAGNKLAGTNLVFQFNRLPSARFSANKRQHYANLAQRFGGNRNPHRVVAYQCN